MGVFGNKKQSKPKRSSTSANEITTLIGEECTFEGNLSSTSSTRIDGRLNGKIIGKNSLIVGENGVIIGEVKAVETIVYGRIDGIIESDKLEIMSTGHVTGEIIIETLIVEDGGTYNGRCEMGKAPESILVEASEAEPKAIKGK